MTNVKVLYEDNHVIAVFKPAGVLAQSDETGDLSVLEEVKNYLKEKYHKPGNVYVGLLHRLDRPVSGIILFAKTSKGASRLSEQFRNREVKKTYQAIVSGKPAKTRGTLTHNIIKDEKLKKGRENPAGDLAVLHYNVLKSNGRYSLLEITIEGGKFHQIRTQVSSEGLPILGDVKYKGEKWPYPESIALCATGLSFKKATEDTIVALHFPTPKEWDPYLSTESP